MHPINTALLSFGMSGKLFHAPFVHLHPGFRFYSVWERTKNLAQEIYPGVKTFRSIEELLDDNDLELVIVNTPNFSHYEYAKMALQAGKHVIVEKPFTATVEEGEELVELANKTGKILSVYQNRRFDPDYRIVKKVLEEGSLGRVVEAEFHFDRYKEDLSPKLHKETPGPGTGALYDLGSHIIDQALQLFGWPQAVFADIRMVREASQVDDYFELLLYYPHLRVRLHSSYLVREPLPGYIIHGNKGSFMKSKSNVQEEALDQGILPGGDEWGLEPESERGYLHTEKNGKVLKEYLPSPAGNYADYFTGIYRSVREGAPLPVTGTEGLAVIRIISAAFQSNRQRAVIAL